MQEWLQDYNNYDNASSTFSQEKFGKKENKLNETCVHKPKIISKFEIYLHLFIFLIIFNFFSEFSIDTQDEAPVSLDYSSQNKENDFSRKSKKSLKRKAAPVRLGMSKSRNNGEESRRWKESLFREDDDNLTYCL